MSISNQIRAKRIALRISQITLAKEAKISRYKLSMFECGYKGLSLIEISNLKATLNSVQKRRIDTNEVKRTVNYGALGADQ